MEATEPYRVAMVPINLRCPAGAWPVAFDGSIAIAAINKDGAEGVSALWVLIKVSGGDVLDALATVVDGELIPTDIEDLQPAIVARADQAVWTLAAVDKKNFYRAIQNGDLHISGDFRLFARFTPALLRLVESTDLWTRVETIRTDLQAPK